MNIFRHNLHEDTLLLFSTYSINLGKINVKTEVGAFALDACALMITREAGSKKHKDYTWVVYGV